MSNIVDLDILRPESRNVKLNGKVFDVSFVPTGCTFEIDSIIRELQGITLKKGKELTDDSDATKKAFDLTIRLCVAFVSHKCPEMDADWFMKSTSPQQVKVFAEAIKEALVSSYAGVEAYSKN